VFQDGARPLDVAQVAVILGWTKDAVRAACDNGNLAHARDYLNAYRIPCSALASVVRPNAQRDNAARATSAMSKRPSR
jgi:hypothetical protein